MLKYAKWVLLLIAILQIGQIIYFPLTDSSEARYATTARDMSLSGDYVTPMVWFQGQQIPYLGKPPLHFWLMSLAHTILGQHDFTSRIPGFISAALLLLIVFSVLKKYQSSEIAWISVIITASSMTFFLLSSGVILDMTLSLGITGAIFLHYAVCKEEDLAVAKKLSLAVFALLAVGFLTKGPIALVLFGLPVFLWLLLGKEWRQLKKYHWFAGLPIFLLVTVPWFVLAERANPGFLYYFFVQENFLRFITPDYGDLYGSGRLFPRGSAILFFMLGTTPWIAITAALPFFKTARKAIWATVKKVDYFLLAFVSMVLFLSLARQALWTYILPAIPIFAVWLANVWPENKENKKKFATIFAVAVVATSLYFAAIFYLAPEMRRDNSTVTVHQYLAEQQADLLATDSVSFLPYTPYTAYYYGHQYIYPHNETDWKGSILTMLAAGKVQLFVIDPKILPELPLEMLSVIDLVEDFGNWQLYRLQARN